MCFKKKTKQIIQPDFKDTITGQKIAILLKSKFPNAIIAQEDEKYKLCTRENIEDFLKIDITDKLEYIDNYRDCEDYSFILIAEIKKSAFSPIPFGLIWVDTGISSHSVNIFIDNERNLYVIEPQNDSIFNFPDKWTPKLVMI